MVKSFQKLACSPENSDNLNFTCYDSNDLNKLKNEYNKRHKDEPIESDNPKVIWDSLRERFHNTCNKESCWLRQKFASSKLGKELMSSFAPQHPVSWKKNSKEWLSSSDITKVMKQYENKYKCFEFIGPSPIDWDTLDENNECIWSELCDFDVKDKLKKNKYKIGIIFNLDKHYQDGSHWVSLFINLKQNIIYYFDSVKTHKLNPIPKEIKRLIKKIQKSASDNNKELNFLHNDRIAHQRKDSECGIYSLYFIINMLKDKLVWGDFLNERISDDEIHMYRKIYFNSEL